MPKLSTDTVTLLDGDIRLTRRSRSRAWQAAFKAGDRLIRISTRCRHLDDAKKRARDQYLEYQLRLKNNLPIVSKRFVDVAATCILDMESQLARGAGKSTFKEYIAILKRFFIPYFGSRHINKITFSDLQKFSQWRNDKMKRDPSTTTVNYHNGAISRVFAEAEAQGYINRSQIPLLINKGKESQRRPDFTREEYRRMVEYLTIWVKAGKKGKACDMRHLLRDYILILANTGIRHGTESMNLCWKHVNMFEDKGQMFLELSVSGKTGRRDIICRAGTERFFQRIQTRCRDICQMTFEELLQSKIDKSVFRLPDGTRTTNLSQTFQIFMKHSGLLTCPRTGLNRTLYSFRHMYATFALLNDELDIHTLAIQMGTSIQMIEQHYSHLTPRLKKEVLTGKRYVFSPVEYREEITKSGLKLDRAALNSAVTDDDGIDNAVPADADGDTASDTVPPVNSEPAANKSKSLAEMAFDLFDEGKLGEDGLIAALGADRSGFELSEPLLQRALKAVGEGRLNEAALMRLMGHQIV